MKFRCDCGHIIRDQTENLPYKAMFIPDEDMETCYTELTENIAAFVEAKEHGERDAFIKRTYGEEYAQELDDQSIIWEFAYYPLGYGRAIYECENCGRIWIQKHRAYGHNVYGAYLPDGDIRGVLKSQGKGKPASFFLRNFRQKQIDDALSETQLPDGIAIRAWLETDFPAIQLLSLVEGWPAPTQRPEHSLTSWRNAWPALVAVDTQTEAVIGFVRGLTDGEVTTFIAELLVAPEHRGHGVGQALLDTCHYLYPHARLDLISTEVSENFYESHGFRLVGQGFRKSYM